MPARLLAAALLVILSHPGQQQPAFRSGTEIILVDVQVSDNKWRPLEGLTTDTFEVSIDGRKRVIANSEFVRVGSAGMDRTAASLSAPPSAARADTIAPVTTGRTLILGVDQSSIQIVNEPAVTEAVTRLLDMAAPEDLIGFVAYPQPGVSVAPTHDRAAVRQALKKVGGQWFPPLTGYNISIAEAVDFSANDVDVKKRVIERECREGIYSMCGRQVEAAARQVMVETEMQSLRSINGLHSLVEAVGEWPGRKTLVVISAGLITTDRIGGRPDVALEADTLGRRAAQANAVIYTLHLDVAFLTQFSAKNRGRVQTVHRDGGLAANGLERFTGNAGGSLITVHAGPDQALRRLLQETSAYYMLAVETMPEDRDGKVHRIQVKVKQRGATVRARSSVFIPKAQ